eukprot:2878244-Rhodomonas_salina.1
MSASDTTDELRYQLRGHRLKISVNNTAHALLLSTSKIGNCGALRRADTEHTNRQVRRKGTTDQERRKRDNGPGYKQRGFQDQGQTSGCPSASPSAQLSMLGDRPGEHHSFLQTQTGVFARAIATDRICKSRART